MKLFIIIITAFLTVLLLTSCSSGSQDYEEEDDPALSDIQAVSDFDSAADTAVTDADTAFTLPPANAPFDYQLGGAYTPPEGVKVVGRDRAAPPAGGTYTICYVNGFQTQPDEADFWLNGHPDLILRDDKGSPVIDPEWPDEMLLDITTSEKRAAIAQIVGGWIQDCAASGFQAVEIDNLDTYSRSGGRISADSAVAMIKALADIAHGAGLAIGQKNSAELLPRRSETSLDFAVSEECNQFDECGDYTDAYGDLVFVIEYDDASFSKGCSNYPQISIIRRDRMLTTPGSADYRYDGC